MKIYLENIGKLSQTEISIDGITVIAGKNGTGKSTISKALYSIFSSFYNYNQKVTDLRNQMVLSTLRVYPNSIVFREFNKVQTESFLLNLYENREDFKKDKEVLKNTILEFISSVDKSNSNRILTKINSNDKIDDEVLDSIVEILFMEEEKLLKYIVKQTFTNEFNKQIQNLDKPSEESLLSLNIKNNTITIKIDQNNDYTISDPLLLTKKIVYIDDPYIIDQVSEYIPFNNGLTLLDNHRDDLLRLLIKERSPESLLVDDSLNKIDHYLNTTTKINIVKESNEYYYNSVNSDTNIDIKNASTGLKTFIIIKMLLENGSLQKNGTIILDEPETHLHPDWQIIFAELIVLLNKYLGIHILINSHSPYFVRAIEVYSAKHKVADKCNYYLTYDDIDTGTSKVDDVTNSLNEIYSKLAEAFDILEEDSVI